MATEIDLENRDPNNINDHLKVQYEDILAEPAGAHSIDCVWSLSYKCFQCWFGLCYKLTTLFCGICIAMEWGSEFASIAFVHIWYITPMMRIFEINCGICKRICTNICSCCCEPCCESCGKFWWAFEKK